MTVYDRFEVKVASLLIGTLEIMWSFLVINPGPSAFYRILSIYGIGVEWFILMFTIGSFVVYGALRPCRKARHIGLSLSVLMWFTLFLTFVWDAWLTPVTLAMPVFGVASAYLLVKDAACKGKSDAVG